MVFALQTEDGLPVRAADRTMKCLRDKAAVALYMHPGMARDDWMRDDSRRRFDSRSRELSGVSTRWHFLPCRSLNGHPSGKLAN
jgi:hypothetical protein